MQEVSYSLSSSLIGFTKTFIGGLPSKEEILAAVPEDGLSFAAMIAKFKPRMTKKEDMALFTTEIKKVCDVDTKNKWIRRRKA